MIYNDDCFNVLPLVKDKSVQFIFNDLPYGITASDWDKKIDLSILWNHYKRILTDNGVCVFTATQPFVTEIINSNPKMYKYSWYWIKNQATNFFHAKRMPLRKIEEILVFYKKKTKYNPQITEGNIPTNSAKGCSNGNIYHGDNKRNYAGGKTTRYPTNVLEINCTDNYSRKHPNEKPLELLEYLIKTYTDPTDVVLDICAGSGNAGIAAKNLDRDFVLCEKEEKFYNVFKGKLQ